VRLFFNYLLIILFSVITLSKSSAAIIGSTGFETYHYFQDPLLESQDSGGQTFFVINYKARIKNVMSGALKAELNIYETIDGSPNNSLKFNQLSWNYYGGSYSILAGVDTVFWGVSESYNAVDIINQTDQSRSLVNDDKLGQPMILFKYNFANFDLGFYYLPFFETRPYAGIRNRFRFTDSTSKPESIFDNGTHNRHLDHAIRATSTVGDTDLSLSYFNGYSRIPWILSSTEGIIEFYQNIVQLGVELQYTGDGQLLKFESAYKSSKLESYYEGVIGAEFNITNIQSSGYDINLFSEYIWNTRKLQPIDIFDNDLFLGLHLLSNNVSSSRIKFGFYVDIESQEKLPTISLESRVFSDFSIAFDAVGYADLDNSAKSITRDSYVFFKGSYNF
jgi:hypothetical protein